MPTTKKGVVKTKTKAKNYNYQPTGILGLDELFRGGLPKGATVLLSGSSGSGKTILALEWLFKGYELFDEPGIYISLTEPISKSLANARKLAFFKEEAVSPMQVYFTDLRGILKGMELGQKELSRKDIDNIIEAVGNMVEQSNAKRVILDSVTAMAYRLNNHDLIRYFIFSLGAKLANLNANVLLTSEVTDGTYSVFGVEEFISDGIISLLQEKKGVGIRRRLEINKMRGTDYSSFPATFRISSKGIELYPRYFRKLDYSISNQRIGTGIKGMDQMTSGGFIKGSTILISGASGTGKTLISLQYLHEGLRKGKRVFLYSLEESHGQIIRNAKQFGWNLEKYEKSKRLTIKVAYAEEHYLEEHIKEIQNAIESTKADLVVIDSLSALANEFGDAVVRDFVSRINAYLKEKMVTTIMTQATSDFIGANEITDAHLSTITDTILMLRFVEVNSELQHALLVLKMRGSNHDKRLRQMTFTKNGLAIESDFKGLEGVISGIARKSYSPAEKELEALFIETFGKKRGQIIQR